MESDQEKNHHPTAKKLEEARLKGEVVRSQEVNVTVIYLIYALTLYTFAPLAFENMVQNFSALWLDVIPHSQTDVEASSNDALSISVREITFSFSILFTLLPISIITVNAAQRNIIFVKKNIHPQMRRISPISGLKNKLGPTGLFDFVKNVFKSSAFSLFLYIFAYQNVDSFFILVNLTYSMGFVSIFEFIKQLTFAIMGISLFIMVADYAWQSHTFTKKNMMSFQEIKDEFREAEGDPHFKGKRQQRAIEITSQHMLADVPKADVVIVNPTHYSVALKWSIGVGNAPIIVAIGVDEIALRIKEIAIESLVPIFEDIPTAQTLTSTHKVGDEIRPEHYAAVAVAIRFSQKSRQL